MQNNYQDYQLLYGLELAKQRYQKQDEKDRLKKSAATLYQPQHFNQYEHPQSIFTRSSLESIPQAQPGMPVIPIPFTLMPWPVESQIQMGFDFSRQQNLQEQRQQRIENIMNLGKPKPISKPESKILYARDQYGNTILQQAGSSQFLQYSYPQNQLSNQQLQQFQQYLQQKEKLEKQKSQQINNMLIQDKINNNQQSNKFEMINDQLLKESFKISQHKSKLSDSLIKSSSHSSSNAIRLRLKKKLAVSTKKFRIFKASVIFISYYIKTLNSEIQKKLKTCREKEKQIPEIFDYMIGQYELVLEQSMIDFLNNQMDYKLEIGKDQDNKKKIDKIFTYLTQLLTEASKVKPESLSSVFFDFLKTICIPGQFPPLDYFIEYEGKRIRFNTIGQIGKISESIQMMIIEGFIILRIIVHQMIFKAGTYHPDQENQGILLFIYRNSLIIGSILCHIYLERYINEVQLKFDWNKVNWNKIVLKPQILDVNDEPDEKAELIKGMLPKPVISYYLKYMQSDVRRYGQLNDLITKICQSYLKELNKQVEIYQTENYVQKPRMIHLIMNTIFREMYVSKKPRRQRSD